MKARLNGKCLILLRTVCIIIIGIGETFPDWAEAERDPWQGWFNILREINFKPQPGAGAQIGKHLVQLWQDSAHKLIDAQASLVQLWTVDTTRTRKQE